jgi:hypothetical protein
MSGRESNNQGQESRRSNIVSIDKNRQGDVWIIPAPEGETLDNMMLVPRDQGRVILAYGEVTGHAHAIVDDDVALYMPRPDSTKKERLLHVAKGPVMLRHEEHGPIPLKPGLYIVRRQREYTPEAIRNVAD